MRFLIQRIHGEIVWEIVLLANLIWVTWNNVSDYFCKKFRLECTARSCTRTQNYRVFPSHRSIFQRTCWAYKSLPGHLGPESPKSLQESLWGLEVQNWVLPEDICNKDACKFNTGVFMLKVGNPPFIGDGPNTVSESTVSNTELSEFVGPRGVLGRAQWAPLSQFFVCAKASSPSFSQSSPSLPQNSLSPFWNSPLETIFRPFPTQKSQRINWRSNLLLVTPGTRERANRALAIARLLGTEKRGLLEKGSFQKTPYSRDPREFRDSRNSREPPDCGKEGRIRPFSRDSRESRAFRDSRDSSSEKTPLV